jgi:hypothetical protein
MISDGKDIDTLPRMTGTQDAGVTPGLAFARRRQTNELYSADVPLIFLAMTRAGRFPLAYTRGKGKRKKRAVFWPACRIHSFEVQVLIYLRPAAIAFVSDPLASSSFNAQT